MKPTKPTYLYGEIKHMMDSLSDGYLKYNPYLITYGVQEHAKLLFNYILKSWRVINTIFKFMYGYNTK